MFLLRFHTAYTDPEKPPIPELGVTLAAQGVKHCAVTDLNCLDGAIEAALFFPEQSIRALTGMEWDRFDMDRVVLLAGGEEGFRWINRLRVTCGSGIPADMPSLAADPEEVAVIINIPGSRLRRLVEANQEREASRLIGAHLTRYGAERLYAALPPAFDDSGLELQQRTVSIFGRQRVKLIATGCRDETGMALSEEDLHRGYERVFGAVEEGFRLAATAHFEWSCPDDRIPELHPGRGLRPESFLWDTCQRRLAERGKRRPGLEERRLYEEFNELRSSGILDVLAILTRIVGNTSLGVPILRFANPWIATSFVSHLVGLHPVDPMVHGIGAETSVRMPPSGVDVTIRLGRDETGTLIRCLEGLFGEEHVAIKRMEPSAREGEPEERALFPIEEESDEQALPSVSQILISRNRWTEILPYSESREGWLETGLDPEALRRLPLLRFHLRPDKLLGLIAKAARAAAARHRNPGLFEDWNRVLRFLSGEGGGRGILSLAISGLSCVRNHRRLRVLADGRIRSRKPREAFQEAIGLLAGAFGSDLEAAKGDEKRHSFAEKILVLTAMALDTPDAYFAAILGNLGLDSTQLMSAVEEAASRGVTVLPPDVNVSETGNTASGDTIRLGLRSIHGIGPVISGSLLEERIEGGPYQSIDDLCERTDRRIVHRAALEALSRSGALDGLDPDRGKHSFIFDRILSGEPRIEGPNRQLLLFDVDPPSDEVPAPLEKAGLGKNPLSPFTEFLASSGVSSIRTLLKKGSGVVTTSGWPTEIEKDAQGYWGYFTDGQATIPILFRCDPPRIQSGSRDALLLFGWPVGKPSGILGLGRKGLEGVEIPSWLEGLPLFLVEDWEDLASVVQESQKRLRVLLELSGADGRMVRALADTLRALEAKDGRGVPVRVKYSKPGPMPRSLKRIEQVSILSADLSLRRLRELPGVLEAAYDETGPGNSGSRKGEKPAVLSI